MSIVEAASCGLVLLMTFFGDSVMVMLSSPHSRDIRPIVTYVVVFTNLKMGLVLEGANSCENMRNEWRFLWNT